MLRRLLSASWLAGAALLSCMCGGEHINAAEFCNSKCLCLGTCSDADRQTCESEWNADQSEAVSEGCEEQFSVYSQCIIDGTGCVSTDYDAGCLDHKDAWQLCVTG